MNKLLLSHVILFLSFFVQAQNIQEQFEKVKKEGSIYQDYQLIKIDKLRSFWTVVSDTLNKNTQDLALANTKIAELNIRIDKLSSSIQRLESELNESESLNASIGFLGININKIAYNLVVWSIIAGLCFSVGFIYLMFKSGNRTTKQAKHDHSVLEEEFEAYKEKATKKQVALKRELQTAINTLEENRIKISSKLGYNRGG